MVWFLLRCGGGVLVVLFLQKSCCCDVPVLVFQWRCCCASGVAAAALLLRCFIRSLPVLALWLYKCFGSIACVGGTCVVAASYGRCCSGGVSASALAAMFCSSRVALVYFGLRCSGFYDDGILAAVFQW